MAEEILKQQEKAEASGTSSEWSPPQAQFGLTEQMLAVVIDSLNALRVTTVAAAGGKPSRPKPFSRPVTAVDRLKAKKNREGQQQILGLFGSNN